ncbi:hypothetical protein TEA_018417 [Camellia sinensis var. sinensis]|uniref:FBD domain-containing protein n=1 Tax=Camellia sinensis var. sinensis TaxID=542762 RepID=A0A4S4CXF2_CAMSN|nr:hypothetical protein TEA_018417 [Camellia sinensis var. sinensis]
MDHSMPKRHKPLDKPQIAEQTLGHNDANNLGEEEDEEDRISDLPDSILCQILQKLPTKFAIGTAILSSRWKPLFYQIPNLSLVINDTLLFHPNSDPLTLNATFISFMYHLLSVTLRDVPKIRHFCLDSHQDYGNVHIDSWVSIVLKLKVQELALFFEKTNCGVSIRGIFSCTTLVHLLLSQHHVLNAIQYSCRPMPTFHKLTKLKLGTMNPSGWQLLPHLLERSPNIQILVFMEGFLDHKGCYEIFERCMSAFVPVCLSLHLQKIKIEGFNGKKDELKLIEYFLKTARVLKTVKIRWACLYWEEKQVGIWKEVLMLPRCSKICQIELAELR